MTRVRLVGFLPALAALVVVGLPSGGGCLAADQAALRLTVGKSLVFDSASRIQRISIANAEVAEAVVVSPQEVLVHGKGAGETSLVIWQEGGGRRVFDLSVLPDASRFEAIRRQIQDELPGQDVSVAWENDRVFLRGTVSDLVGAQRAAAIAATLGKDRTVNLLKVRTPAAEPQILLRVRFANVDRSAGRELGVNFFRIGDAVTTGAITTGQFNAPRPGLSEDGVVATLSDALNIFLFRKDLDLGVTIRALQANRLLEILAEPNLLAMNGRKASFLAGGEFPYPVVQGGALNNAVTIQFKEFGIRITFLPSLTPRGTIRLHVHPEVSSLDFANALTFQGFNIPALTSRRVETEVELEDKQSFVIAGLLDNRVADVLSKIPGISAIPVLGKLFQSRSLSKSDTELLVLVTPELVRPLSEGQPQPNIEFPEEFQKGPAPVGPRHPGAAVTGPAEKPAAKEALPVETLLETQQKEAAAQPGAPVAVPAGWIYQPLVAPAGTAPAPPASPSPDSGSAAAGGEARAGR